MNERWFPAKMTPPDFGMFSLPTTQGRNTVNSSGPTNRFLSSQYSIPSASQVFRVALYQLACGVDPGKVGGADDAGVVDELRDGELRLRVETARGQVRKERLTDGIQQHVARHSHSPAKDQDLRI